MEPGHTRVNQSQGREEKWGCAKGGVLLRPHVPMQNAEESENSKFKPGLPGHYEGTLVKAGVWHVFQ